MDIQKAYDIGYVLGAAEKLAIWNKYGCKYIEMIGSDDVQARYSECFHTLLKN